MQNYQVTDIGPDFEILVVEEEPFFFTEADVAKIEYFWLEAQKQRGGSLFNGKLLSVVDFKNGKLIGKFVDYKFYIAQIAAPELELLLRISPISISCICSFRGKLLLGRRSQKVTEFPGYYELVPSGGIDPSNVTKGIVDISSQALLELEEEAFLVRKLVKKVTPFVLIKELRSGRCEVCIEIVLDSKMAERHESPDQGEYSELLWISPNELQEFFLRNAKVCVPFSLFLFHEFLVKRNNI